MKKWRKIFLISLSFLYGSVSFAFSTEEKKELPPGMEVIKMGQAQILVPKGTKVNQEPGFITLESTEQYVARKFLDVEGRIKVLEDKEEVLKKKTEELETKIAELHENI
ncbi:MAG: hypothetical protein KAJ10_03820 [Thermodesulfovibrionia bacterium]|nr:hypothetical protein [Thermodesulfovibrionia bacterium]